MSGLFEGLTKKQAVDMIARRVIEKREGKEKTYTREELSLMDGIVTNRPIIDHDHDDEPQTLADQIGQHIGTGDWYECSLLRDKYVITDGLKQVADQAGAYWLVADIVASYMSRQLDKVAKGFQVWRIRKLADDCVNQAEVTAWTDTPDKSKRLVRQLIPNTDFFEKFGADEFQWYVNDTIDGMGRWTGLLKSEY